MAVVDYFLKIDGIEGESTDAKHKGEIELLSWSWGASNSAQVASGNARGGRVSFQDFQFTKHFDKSSPQIFQKCVGGQHITSMTLSARKASNSEVASTDYMKIVFSNCLVSFYKEQAPNLDEINSDEVGVLFQKMSLTFIPVNPVTGAAADAPVTATADATVDGG